MPATYTLIASNTLSSSAASVTFSSIPATYTDLVIRLSARNSSTASDRQDIRITCNSVGGTSYSYRLLRGNGSAASSTNSSNDANINVDNVITADGAVSNTFGSVEFYIPSYTASQNKPINAFGAGETNATAGYLTAAAGLFSNTSAIASITLATNTANFMSGSSFFLYGIKNS